jgi:hypothetical protein
MESMRQSWTDERLDDFREDVARRFDETNQRMDAGFARVDAELQGLNGRFDALQHTLAQIGFMLAVGLLGVIVALFGVIATQL